MPQVGECWFLTYDDGNQEDRYILEPSDMAIDEAREAAPDAKTALYYSPNGLERNLVQEWEPLEDE
jgi:hypothetical protein